MGNGAGTGGARILAGDVGPVSEKKGGKEGRWVGTPLDV